MVLSLRNKEDKKVIIFSIVCFFMFVEVLTFIFMDGVGGWANDGVSGFIEQANLKWALGNWYQLVFLTVQVNIIFSFFGTLFFVFRDSAWIKNILFCFSSFLLLCLLSLLVFSWSSLKTNPYEAWKTVFLHALNPLTSFILILMMQGFKIDWKGLKVCSLYLTFYYVMAMIIYYNFQFTSKADESLVGKPLWIYAFLDFSRSVLFISIKNIWYEIIINGFFLLLTPLFSLSIFTLMSIVLSADIEFKKPFSLKIIDDTNKKINQ